MMFWPLLCHNIKGRLLCTWFTLRCTLVPGLELAHALEFAPKLFRLILPLPLKAKNRFLAPSPLRGILSTIAQISGASAWFKHLVGNTDETDSVALLEPPQDRYWILNPRGRGRGGGSPVQGGFFAFSGSVSLFLEDRNAGFPDFEGTKKERLDAQSNCRYSFIYPSTEIDSETAQSSFFQDEMAE
jgi:hypothetical protein